MTKVTKQGWIMELPDEPKEPTTQELLDGARYLTEEFFKANAKACVEFENAFARLQ